MRRVPGWRAGEPGRIGGSRSDLSSFASCPVGLGDGRLTGSGRYRGSRSCHRRGVRVSALGSGPRLFACPVQLIDAPTAMPRGISHVRRTLAAQQSAVSECSVAARPAAAVYAPADSFSVCGLAGCVALRTNLGRRLVPSRNTGRRTCRWLHPCETVSNRRHVLPFVPKRGPSLGLDCNLRSSSGWFCGDRLCETWGCVPTYVCKRCGWTGTWFRVEAVRVHDRQCPGCQGTLRLAFTDTAPTPTAAQAADTRADMPGRQGRGEPGRRLTPLSERQCVVDPRAPLHFVDRARAGEVRSAGLRTRWTWPAGRRRAASSRWYRADRRPR